VYISNRFLKKIGMIMMMMIIAHFYDTHTQNKKSVQYESRYCGICLEFCGFSFLDKLSYSAVLSFSWSVSTLCRSVPNGMNTLCVYFIV
jgi:hypothetical protein